MVSDPEKFPEINFVGKEAQGAILQLINDSFDEDDIEMTAEEASEKVEKFLHDRALKLADSPTVKKMFQEVKTLGPPKASTKTITNQMTTSSQKPSSKPFHLMSESEQLAEAIRRVNAAKLQR